MTAVIPLLVRRIRAVLATDKPVAEAIAALIMTSTLIVVGSASAYFSLESSRPGQFRGLETKLDAVYFAVVVMSTIGFGDIAPTGQAARLLATLHIVVTVSLVGAAVRLLGWAARQRLDRD
ncbi:MAG TPA: potassium channel family protein [Acidimicrobiales bacterium]|nr:potassium channel family protein [Acidimicrobiales bacterium]